MSVRDFELFHGAALTKLVRADSKVSLLLTETRPKAVWAAYELNSEVYLYVKHSANPQKAKKKKRTWLKWQFTFEPTHLVQIKGLKSKRMDVYVALVCGSPRLEDQMEICLLDPGEFERLIDLGATGSQWIRVQFADGTSLHAFGSLGEQPVIVPRNRLDTWAIPGG